MNGNYQLAVIGTGSGGSEAAVVAAKKGFKVVVIENGALGGTASPRVLRGTCSSRVRPAAWRIFQVVDSKE
jgi:pyruvate/2-oxoglutarate dehydrogenase complex dihydrolipoamide dehydrogenase (E3) component